MKHADYMHMTAVMAEHAKAVQLLQAVSDGEEDVLPKIYAFLKSVAARKTAEQVRANVKSNNLEKRKKGGRKNSGAFEVCPRLESGADFGSTGLVLARKGNVRLIWRSGHKYWANMLEGSVYAPGNLVIMTSAEGHRRPGVESLTQNHRNAHEEGTRLSRALIEKFATRIDEVFGQGAAERVGALKETLVVPDQAEAAC